MIELYPYQIKAINQMKNGCILCGGVGSGKSLTSLGYFHLLMGGKLGFLTGNCKDPMYPKIPIDIYIITTAKKRDDKEWEKELIPFNMVPNETNFTPLGNRVFIDSWNNISKYTKVKDSFFIFDEQRVVGKGSWTKSFLRIVKSNQWILLSATPGDTWSDYIPVFIANGFYKNPTEFYDNHVVWNRAVKWPQVKKYYNEGILIHYRNDILVDMDFERSTVRHMETVYCDYNIMRYKFLRRNRCDISELSDRTIESLIKLPIDIQQSYLVDCTPFENGSMLCYQERKLVNEDPDRQRALLEILEDHKRAIIFYNFDYELDILKSLGYEKGTIVAEWNGHKHEPVPKSEKWIYLVQYTAGCEGWNCITTDTMIFFSQSYSYKQTEQACGRIDRINTMYKDLYYYSLKSHASIDMAISRALHNKQNFNERRYLSTSGGI